VDKLLSLVTAEGRLGKYLKRYGKDFPMKKDDSPFKSQKCAPAILHFLFMFFLLIVFIPSCSQTMSGKQKDSAPVLSPDARIQDARTRRGDHYAEMLSLFLKNTPEQKPGGIVFLGDSITEQFPLDRAFPQKNVINRGIGGDRIEGVAERLDVSVNDLSPSRVYLMIGVNDILFTQSVPVSSLGKLYGDLLVRMKRSAPNTAIMVQSVLPVSGNFAKSNPRIVELNTLIKNLSEKEGIPYIDLHSRMTNYKGELRDEFTFDGVHLTLEGYLEWLEAIVPSEEFFDVALSLAPLFREKHKTSHPVAAIDPPAVGKYPGSRGKDQLIIYTPKYERSSTGTNEWGNEAVIENGRVTRILRNDSPVPANGYVISGHGSAGAWIYSNLKPGMTVEYNANKVRFFPVPETDFVPRERLAALRSQWFNLLGESLENKSSSSLILEAKKIFQTLQDLKGRKEDPDPEELMNLERDLKALEDKMKKE